MIEHRGRPLGAVPGFRASVPSLPPPRKSVKRIEAKLYVADGPADAHLLRGLLEAEGLTAFVRDDGMVPLQAVGFFKMENAGRRCR